METSLLGFATAMNNEVHENLKDEYFRERPNATTKDNLNMIRNAPILIEGDVATDIEEVENIKSNLTTKIWNCIMFAVLLYTKRKLTSQI